MEAIEIIGFAAGLMVAMSSLPQFIKSLKTKSTQDVSALWLIINMLGQALWLTYGVLKSSQSLIVMSAITFCMVGAVLWLKFKYED